jgi:predicted metalloendopeptidase
MLADIQWAFSSLVHSADWMDEDTKVATLDKAAAVKQFVGFPEWLLDSGQLEDYYEGVSTLYLDFNTRHPC